MRQRLPVAVSDCFIEGDKAQAMRGMVDMLHLWPASRCPGHGAEVPHRCCEPVRSGRSAGQRTHGRRFAASSGGPGQRPAPSRARVRRSRIRPSPVVHESLSDRCVCGRARLPRAGSSTAGISGPGEASSRKQHRGCQGCRSLGLIGLRPDPGPVPDRLDGRRFGCGGASCRTTARPYDTACAGTLARCWP